MACPVVSPLERLRHQIAAPELCFDHRPECRHALPRIAELALGADGTTRGYCQGLFGPPSLKAGDAGSWTERVTAALRLVGAPDPESHELCFCGTDLPDDLEAWMEAAIAPLRLGGRVPILLTDLTASHELIERIFAARPPSFATGATMLVRLLVRNHEDVAAAASRIHDAVAEAKHAHAMPIFWPLLQAPPSDLCAHLRSLLGDDWGYTVFAINPFTDAVAIDSVFDQVCVAQYPIGRTTGITPNQIRVDGDLVIAGVPQAGGSYDTRAYAERLSRFPVSLIRILLGPARPDWPAEENLARVRMALGSMDASPRTKSDVVPSGVLVRR